MAIAMTNETKPENANFISIRIVRCCSYSLLSVVCLGDIQREAVTASWSA